MPRRDSLCVRISLPPHRLVVQTRRDEVQASFLCKQRLTDDRDRYLPCWPCRPHRSDTAEAEQDDSLVVHPATQAADAEVESEGADDASESEDEGGVDSQGFWEAEAIVRYVLLLCDAIRRINFFRRLVQLDETRSQYLIAWKGVDEKGNRWKPTWVSFNRPRAPLFLSLESDPPSPRRNRKRTPTSSSSTLGRRLDARSGRLTRSASSRRRLRKRRLSERRRRPVASARARRAPSVQPSPACPSTD